ncbi:DUF4446 family protein [Paenibacillus sp. JX-17]|uniref:DUF4446 family protein n=1 Tax=Paenibacillus lacisoli TaxID=3064525 RepID=A0ABT9CA91_9BACL|nr:DUF4446 family protein [Paenibacillus sp. JX-17]MDO7906169.1 DUF4446 family protein [Paenibacillus sp. JX-17]
MAEMNELISEQLAAIVGILALLVAVLLVIVMVQGSVLRKMRRKYEVMMAGSGVDNLETLLIDLKMQLDQIEDEQGIQQTLLRTVNQKLSDTKGKVGIKRFNAFGERGGELSFSLAILNEGQDGIVLTGIYNRDGSYVYAKPLEAGSSPYSLSDEEKEAITLALQAK